MSLVKISKLSKATKNLGQGERFRHKRHRKLGMLSS